MFDAKWEIMEKKLLELLSSGCNELSFALILNFISIQMLLELLSEGPETHKMYRDGKSPAA